MKMQESHKKSDLIQSTPGQTGVINVVTPSIEKGSDVQQVSTNVLFVRRLVILVACGTREKIDMLITWSPLVHPRHINWRLDQFILKILWVASQKVTEVKKIYWLCLELQVQWNQGEAKFTVPQHLVTNLEYVLKPHKKKTKILRARIDTCVNVNLKPISEYKLLYKDPDCVMLVPSSKDRISTYTAEKINVLGSCDRFVVHPDTKCLKEVTFQVVNHEGSVIVSCVTSLDLGLIHPQNELNASVPDCGRLIFSSADHPNKYQSKKIESMFEGTASCWNKVHWLNLSWQAFADLHTKATLYGLREMLDLQINGTTYLDGVAVWGINMDVRGRRIVVFWGCL